MATISIMSDKKNGLISKWQVFVTLLLSLINTLLVVVLLSIYWPAEPIERMAAASMFLPVIWIIFILVGLLARNLKHSLLWQSAILLLSVVIATLHFI